MYQDQRQEGHANAGPEHARGPTEPDLDAHVTGQIQQAASRGPAETRTLLAQLMPAQRDAALRVLHLQYGNAFVAAVMQGGPRQDPADAARTALQSDSGGPLQHQEAIQAAFGAHDVSSIRLHRTQAAARGAVGVQAESYTSGEDVANFSGTLQDEAHEAAHVVKRRGDQQGGGVIDDAAEEDHADAVAKAVVEGKDAQPLLDQVAKPGTTAQPGGIARIKDTKNGNAPIDVSTFSEQQCYMYLTSDPHMTPGTLWCGWQWEDGDKAAIEGRFNSLKGGQFATFKSNLTNGMLDAKAAERKIDPHLLATFDGLVDAMKSDPRVINFESWFYGSIAFSVNDPDKLLDSINELRAAQARLGSLQPGEKIDLAERGTGTTKSTGEEYTADGTIDGAAQPTQYEVKTVRAPGYDVSGITSQINEGLKKFEKSANGSYEVDIYAAYEDAARSVALGGSGATRAETPDPAAGKIQHQITANGSAKPPKDYVFKDEIQKWLNKTWGGTKGKANKVNIHMENGLSLALTRSAGAWT